MIFKGWREGGRGVGAKDTLEMEMKAGGISLTSFFTVLVNEY